MTAAVDGRRRPRIVDAGNAALIDRDDAVVVLLWHLGDVLNCTAFFPFLAQRHPGRLALATTRRCLPVVQENPHLSKVFAIDLDIPDMPTFDHFGHIRDLAAKYFSANTVYNLHIPIFLRGMPDHYLERWRDALGLDMPLSALRPTYYPRGETPTAEAGPPVVVFANGGMIPIKRWPLAHWRRLVGKVRQAFPRLRLVQLGSAADAPLDGVEDLRGKTDVDASYRMLQSATACITNDSFLAHLAAAAECPTYVIYGHTSPRNFRPLGPGPVMTFGGRLPCAPCYRARCPWSLGFGRCLAFQSPRQVFDTLARRLEHDDDAMRAARRG